SHHPRRWHTPPSPAISRSATWASGSTAARPPTTDHRLPTMENLQTRSVVGRRSSDGWMLRHISFSVPRGTSLAIVGATGAGKTTLVNLLARVRDPDEGAVLVDGQDIRTLPLDDLRRGIGYVPQDTFLFSVPLRENVTFGRADASEAEIERATRVSRLSNDLPQFPDGL